MTIPPLQVFLLAHPRSRRGAQLASGLQQRLVEPPASGGLRVPVFFTPERDDDLPPLIGHPDGINLGLAQHTLVVVLADERMLRTVPEGTGSEWKKFVQEIRTLTPLDQSPHHLLCVALDTAGFAINNEIHILSAHFDSGQSPPGHEGFERALSGASFHIAARAIQLLEHGKISASAPERIQAPVRIFLSHAKADLSKDHSDPVRATQRACDSENYPIEKWFDSRNIATSQAFEKAIQAGIRDCSIMLVFQSDHYGSRPWCRREVIEAKRLGAHIVVVDILENGEQRRFPYVGNVPVIRWRNASEPEIEARRIIDRAVLEALRFKFNHAYLKSIAAPGEIVLAAPPEAFNLATSGGVASTIYLYPDPPLGREELEILHELSPTSSFITPLTKLASNSRLSETGYVIAVSISESDDIARYGLSDRLFATLIDEIHLYLLLAGLKIAYGGALKGDFSSGSNFTLRLFDLVTSYSKLAEGIQAKPLTNAIHNIAPWPLHLTYGDSEWALFAGNVAEYTQVGRPNLPWSDDEIFPDNGEKRNLASDTPIRRYAWARGLSDMREQMTSSVCARIVIGGKLHGFAGLLPGVIEEAWMSIHKRRPLFVVGAYGGSGRAVCDLLLGVDRPEFSDEWAKANIADFEDSCAYYQIHGEPRISLPEIAASIRHASAEGIDQALNNGLGINENIELMRSSNPQRISSLILTGLARLMDTNAHRSDC